MTIQQFIEVLQKHPNQNAKINWNINVTDVFNEQEDISAEVNIIALDDPYNDFVDILVTPTQLTNQ